MIYAKALPYSDPTQIGKFYISWSAVQPMIRSINADGDSIEIPDSSYIQYNVSDPIHLDASSGTIVII